MKIRRIVAIALALCMVLAQLPAQAGAAVSSIQILSAVPREEAGEMTVKFMAGASESVAYTDVGGQNLNCTAGQTALEVLRGPASTEGVAYIFVVDCSAYHLSMGFDVTSTALKVLTGAMRSQDRAAFVTVSNTVSERNTFMDAVSAVSFAESMRQESNTRACLYDGIAAAFALAANAPDYVPQQKVIVVLTDAMDNQESRCEAAELFKMREALDGVPVFSVLTYKGSGATNKEADRIMHMSAEGRTMLIDLCGGMGAALMVDGAKKATAKEAEAAARQIVDYTRHVQTMTLSLQPLHNAAGQAASYDLTIRCGDGTGSLPVTINAAKIPAPVVVVTPSPTPRVIQHLYDTTADLAEVIRVQSQLKELFYLPQEFRVTGIYDAQTLAAIDQYCDRNGYQAMNYMSVEVYDALLNGNSVANPTATPVPVVTPDPSVYIFPGDSGSAVREVRQRLAELNYLDSAVGNAFDDAAQYATDEFCRRNGLATGDGMSHKIHDLLMSADAVANPLPMTPTPDPSIKLAPGAEGLDVRLAQDKLDELCFYETNGANYGVLDSDTLLAISEFCRLNGLEVGDGLTIAAWELLMNGDPKPAPTVTPMPTAEPTATPIPGIRLFLHDENGDVQRVQDKLEELGYYRRDAETYGLMDRTTLLAINEFCKQNGLTPDAGLTDAAWELLMAGEPKPAPTATPAPTAEPTATPDPDIKLTPENTGYEVKLVQDKLAKLGYYEREADTYGIMDTKTQIAINDFCAVNSLKTGDGLTMEAWLLLSEGKGLAKPTPTPAPTAEPTATPDPSVKLFPDAQGRDVQLLQERLAALGYYDIKENKDDYGRLAPATMLALRDFCQLNGISTGDGVTVETWELLMNGDPVRPTALPTATPAPTPDPGMKLTSDSPAGDVQRVQDRLQELWYYTVDEAAYGTLDTRTQLAINAFCDENGLGKVAGMSTAAWELLMSGAALPKTTPVPEGMLFQLYVGEYSEGVRAYQARLHELKYLEGGYTPGMFDAATQTAQDDLCAVNGIAQEYGASPALQTRVYSAEIQPKPLDEIITAFLGGTLVIFGYTLPTWAAVLAAGVIVLAVLVTILLLLKPKKKVPAAVPGMSAFAASEMTADFSRVRQTSEPDAPTTDFSLNQPMEDMRYADSATVQGDVWQVALSAEYNSQRMERRFNIMDDGTVTIGRGSDVDIRLDETDRTMSRHQGTFTCRGGKLYFANESANGTVADGVKLAAVGEEAEVKPGSVLRMGHTTVSVTDLVQV